MHLIHQVSQNSKHMLTDLYGSLELLHLPPRLVVLPADHVDDGAEEGEPHQDEQHRHPHVHRLVRADGCKQRNGKKFRSKYDKSPIICLYEVLIVKFDNTASGLLMGRGIWTNPMPQ